MTGQRTRAGFAAVAINCLCIWVALVGFGYATNPAHSQDNVACGNLYLRVDPDSGHLHSTSGSWFLFQVFRRSGGDERPLFPSRPYSPSKPSARCVGGSVLMIAFSPASGTPSAFLVFQDGSHLLELQGDGDYEFGGDGFIIPPRPRLLQSARERVPAEYRSLFDYSGRKLYVD